MAIYALADVLIRCFLSWKCNFHKNYPSPSIFAVSSTYCYSTLELCVGQVSLLQVVIELDSLATGG